MTPGEDGPDHGPGVRIPPPVMVGGALLLAWGLARVAPVPLGAPLPGLGTALVVLALAWMGWAVVAMVRAGTDPRPDKPDSALLEQGPFRWSRNPIYLGFLIAAAGLALCWGELWGWLAVAASYGMLRWWVIAREEAYLAGRFGERYEGYRGRVRRWV